MVEIDHNNRPNHPLGPRVAVVRGIVQREDNSEALAREVKKLRNDNNVLKYYIVLLCVMLFSILVLCLCFDQSLIHGGKCRPSSFSSKWSLEHTESHLSSFLEHLPNATYLAQRTTTMLSGLLGVPSLQLRCKSALNNTANGGNHADCIHFRQNTLYDSLVADRCTGSSESGAEYFFVTSPPLISLCYHESLCTSTANASNCLDNVSGCEYRVSTANLSVNVVQGKDGWSVGHKVFFTIGLKSDPRLCFACPQTTAGTVFLSNCSTAADDQLFYLNGTGVDYSIPKWWELITTTLPSSYFPLFLSFSITHYSYLLLLTYTIVQGHYNILTQGNFCNWDI